VKHDWRSLPFAACVRKVRTPPKIKRKEFLDSGQYPIVSQEADEINGYWDVETDVFRIPHPVVIFGDHTRVLKYVDFDFVMGADGVKILQPIEQLHPRYFFYVLSAFPVKHLGYARHYRLLKELNLPIAPLPEQERIVAILDEASEAIEELKAGLTAKLAHLQELKQSILQKAFSGELTTSAEPMLQEARL
jgi:type I restriction enzyme, S subunit